MRTRKASAVLLAAVLTLGLGSACGEAEDGNTTGEGNLRDSGEQNSPSEGGDTGDATEDDSAPAGSGGSGTDVGGTGSGAGSGAGGAGTQTSP